MAYPPWTKSPELHSQLRMQELGGAKLASVIFGPVAEVDYYGRGPSSERFTERSSQSPVPATEHVSTTPADTATESSNKQGLSETHTDTSERRRQPSTKSVDLLAAPPRRAPISRSYKSALAKGFSTQKIDLTNTGFAAQPSRRPKPKIVQSSGSIVGVKIMLVGVTSSGTPQFSTSSTFVLLWELSSTQRSTHTGSTHVEMRF